MANDIISVILKFSENMSQQLTPLIQKMNSFQDKTETLRNVMTPLSAASGVFLAGAAKSAFDFSVQLKEAKKGLSLTESELKSFGNAAKETSENLNFQIGSGQILEIATAAGKLGVAKNDLTSYTEGLVRLAVATDQLENIVDLNENVAKINSVFKMGIPELEKYYGAVNMLADSTAANPQQLIRFTQQIAGTASSAGISAKNISAWGATLIDAGQQSGEAATFIRNFSIKLGAAENQSKTAKDAFASLGYSAKDLATAFDRDAEGAMIGFLERVKELQKVDSVAATRVMASVFGAENVSNANLLLGKLEDLKKNLKLVADDNANAAKLTQEFAVSSEGLDGALRALKNVLNEVMIEVGTAFLPGIVKATQAILEFVKPVLAFVRQNPAIAATIASLLGIVAVIAPILHLVSLFSTVLGMIPGLIAGFGALTGLFTGAIGIIGGVVSAIGIIPIAIAAAVAAVAALGYAIYQNWGSISQWFTANVGNPIGKSWESTMKFLENKTNEFANYFKNDPIKASISVAKWVAPIPSLFGQAFLKASQEIVKFISWIGNMEQHFRNAAVSWGKGLLQGFIDGIQSMYASVTTTMSQFTNYIGQWLPHSDAKKGELSRLIASGKAFATTFLEGIESVGLDNILNDTFSLGDNFSNLIPSSANSSPTGNQSPINITYNITARDSEDILKQLKERDRQLLDLINRSGNRINRPAY